MKQQAKVHLITGGQRSGKSVFAEKLASSLSDQPIYLATSKKGDGEFDERIKVHQQRRSVKWKTIEEEINLHLQDLTGKVVLVDCITLWLTNIYDEFEFDKEKTLVKAEEIWEKLISQNCHLIVVSNEIGLGGISMHKMTRNFTDIHGLINQKIANKAQEVTFIVSGYPMIVKS
ncbi:bifunctional adenosylcobinamide kinase/adenosylcobinamide-phosphate guanylyltransferase [Flammeovirga pacifica]|uniref:Adenosylcobinamide kinase n=1 Tax=Flammeovirga pacifica TaxID=915059 RepID=A0A1S1YXX8_FLAPC|nr:bifunctional adenosylcobinamide kinase/adenosylcobinamide-phosphate guanylyltransferase [Flammeovirga pacifica]OHX65861.1 hypothetical protein NH26_05595 [Flammeovirga pacifica]